MSLEFGIYLVEKTINPATFKRSIESSDSVEKAIGVGVSRKTINPATFKKLGSSDKAGRTIDIEVSGISSIIMPGDTISKLESGERPIRIYPTQALPAKDTTIEIEERLVRTSSTLRDCYGNPIIKLSYRGDKYTPQRDENRVKRIARLGIVEDGSVSLVRYEKNDFIESHFALTRNGYSSIINYLKENTDLCWTDIGAESDNYRIFLNADNFLIIQTKIDTKGLEMATEIAKRQYTKLTLKPKPTTPDFNKNVYDALVKTYESLNWLFF